MAFVIEYNNDCPLDNEAISGVITIGDHNENFISPIGYWQKENYKKQWRNAIDDIVARKSNTVCLITSIQDLTLYPFVVLWVLYLKGDFVYVQNMMLNTEDEYKDFDENFPCNCLPKRETIDEDGNEISEWKISIWDFV